MLGFSKVPVFLCHPVFGSGWGCLIVTGFAYDFIIIKQRRAGGDEVPCIHNLVIRTLPSLFGHLHSFGQIPSYCWLERPQCRSARSLMKRREGTFYIQILPQHNPMIFTHLHKRLIKFLRRASSATSLTY